MKTGKLKSVGVVTLLADETPRLGWKGGRGWNPRSWEPRLSSGLLFQIATSDTTARWEHINNFVILTYSCNDPRVLLSSFSLFIRKNRKSKGDSELELWGLEQTFGLLKSEDRSAPTMKSLSMDSFREMFQKECWEESKPLPHRPLPPPSLPHTLLIPSRPSHFPGTHRSRSSTHWLWATGLHPRPPGSVPSAE